MCRPSGVGFCIFGFGGFFDLHVVKLFGVKDIATFQAFDIFRVFLPGDNTYAWVFADGGHGVDSIGFEWFSNCCIAE
jgi:hypothetical protein